MLIRGDARQIPLADKSVQCVITSPPYYGLRVYLADGDARKALEIGGEDTPDEYISTMVHIFRDVRRVLRDDGTVWLNLGDSYVNNGIYEGSEERKTREAISSSKAGKYGDNHKGLRIPGLKPKDLIGIPWRVALALQADGWYLRADIIWAKGNPMPESCTDRPTKSHEYIFLLSKNERYFYDNEAVKVPTSPEYAATGRHRRPDKVLGPGFEIRGGLHLQEGRSDRNLRSVWTVNLRPYKGAHFATFPPELITPCIKAGTSQKGRCPTCGAPWRRVVERKGVIAVRGGEPCKVARGNGRSDGNADRAIPGGYVPTVKTLGWEPSCACPAHEPQPCILFDPFVGSGTTVQESQRLGRVCVGMELSEKSLKLARDRIERPHKPQSARDPGEFLPLFDRDGDASR